MKLTKYGYDVIIISLLISTALILSGLWFNYTILKLLLITLGVLFAAFTLYFFRDPERTVPQVAIDDENIVISPADGKVVIIQEIDDKEYHNGKAIQICIFLSPLNVHVNRFPISGKVDYFKYVEGKFIVAFDDKASDVNERTHLGISNNKIKVFFKQIAGAVARRIVCPVNVGDFAKVGDKFGMIKFGSRMDIVVPVGTVINVKVNDLVIGGETILCNGV
ncbi:MAG: phosphatidylserine decarboxylase family protein [Chlorobiota bacterium]|nr:MAG: phosphatidylserine decarboxylase family protein [Chlorobiota bacterium]